MTGKLDRAAQHAAEVTRRVRAHRSANAVARGLIQVATADLRDPATQRAFVRHAPAIVQSLALIDESRTDFLTPRDFAYHAAGFATPVELSIDTRGRAAESMITTLFGCSLPDALDDSLRQLVGTVDTAVAVEIERYRGETGDIGPISIDYLWVSELLARASKTEKLRRYPRLSRYAGKLAAAVEVLLEAMEWGESITLDVVWDAIENVMSRSELRASVTNIGGGGFLIGEATDTSNLRT